MPPFLLIAALLAPPAQPPDCPDDKVVVATEDPYEPFRCVDRDDKSQPVLQKLGSFQTKPRCPQGSRPVRTPGGIQRYRCLPMRKPETEPDITPRDKPAKAVAVSTEPEGYRVAPNRAAVSRLEYARYEVPGVVEFEYPKDWHVTDAWSDEIPTLYFELDTGRSGKPVTLVLTRYEPRQAGFYPMDTALAKEKEWRNAVEQTPRPVGGRRARLTIVRGDSRAAFVPYGVDGAYFTVSYGAPEDLFASYEPAYERLLDSFKMRIR